MGLAMTEHIYAEHYAFSDTSPTKRQIEILAAWRQARTYKGAARILELSESTVKNTMGLMRLRAKTNNAGLVKRYWRLLALLEVDPNMNYRKMRYEIDNDYRERQRRAAREKMRQIRAIQAGNRERIYAELFEKQGGVCAICRKPESAFAHKTSATVRRLAIDHDHSTGQVRALLCRSCNMMLGAADDDPRLLRIAIEYLEKHSKPTQHNVGEAA